MAALITQELRKGWEFKQAAAEEWLPVARVPTNVHLDLMDNKKIEDQFLGFNELKCEWVGHKDWIYRVTLPSISTTKHGTKHVLAFDGLDTYATVELNGHTILESDNMWIMHRVDVSDKLSSSNGNTLPIYFKAALPESQRVKAAYPEHKWVGFNGDMARLAARKAQYHYGWDWGPVLLTCGPWRSARLETYHAWVEDVRVDYEVDASFKKVSGAITATIEGAAGETVDFCVKLGEEQILNGTAEVHNGKAAVDFYIDDPKLWYPHGYGEQTLYNVTATVRGGDESLHSVTKRTGFRKGELVQELDEIGKSFYFRFNGIDVFCGGSDWIPADSFTPRITEARYGDGSR
ncbi:hypothetical protein LTR56_026437 [Elasticomyces elasticus]|nr:hypothetical protein LTR56_026437 [Elasticomyces elasticus]KAK3616446.1 hypothetical protein LTR22_027065 [Elasticomyces elasticus]KAK4901075.1 hypothetical protein LTR49_027326 [Elasticomyces elasticus]KAK5736497.1 hypothetical protein LTS12_026153 [Elasticomyces elasticus]